MAPRFILECAVDISADGQRGPGVALFPCGGEGRAPGIAAVKAPFGRGVFKLALALPTEGFACPHAQHHKIHSAITVDVEWVSARHMIQFSAGFCFSEFERAAAFGFVDEEFGWVFAARDINIWKAVAVAVEAGHTAARHILPLAFVDRVEARGFGDIGESGDASVCPCRRYTKNKPQNSPWAGLTRPSRNPATKLTSQAGSAGQARRWRVNVHFTIFNSAANFPMHWPWVKPRSMAARKWMPP